MPTMNTIVGVEENIKLETTKIKMFLMAAIKSWKLNQQIEHHNARNKK